MVVVGVVVARVAMIVGVAIIIDIAIVVALVIAVVVSSALSFTPNDVLRWCVVVVAIVVASVVACRCLVGSRYRGGFHFLPAFASACAGPHFSYAKDSAQASLMSAKTSLRIAVATRRAQPATDFPTIVVTNNGTKNGAKIWSQFCSTTRLAPGHRNS